MKSVRTSAFKIIERGIVITRCGVLIRKW
jgi:hypothetical protein